MNNNRFIHLLFENYCRCIKNNHKVLNKFIHSKTNPLVSHENVTFEKYKHRIIYNCEIEKQKLKLGYRRNKAFEEKQKKEEETKLLKKCVQEPLPVSLKYFNANKSNESVLEKEQETTITQFPYKLVDKFSFNENNEHVQQSISAENEVLFRNKHYKNETNWMTDYEYYDDNIEDSSRWELNYGTADPKCQISNVPCGGCGALLHCKDTSIPGYVPSEIFKNTNSNNLKSILCQRCHFLKYYDMALQVRVSAEDYPNVLEKIKENKNSLVVLMVDLLDFPCSIWPNIIDIIGRKRPVVIVGNKIDLLPQDSRGYLDRIKNILAESAYDSNLKQANVQHISLISAKTGFGVEELITKLHNIWRYRGDVYLVGCTNVGKSTLFNVLLQSDYCKVQAVDLIQRATTSPWPGTTLNLLKFPILRPSGWRLYVRTKRLMSLNKIASQERRLRKIQLQKTRNSKYATIMGKIERSFTAEEPIDDTKDIFAVQGNASSKAKMGINENDPDYKLSKWCYDTPGVIQPDQTLHLLTTEELMLTLPKELIRPRTFSVKPGYTIFLAGLGRLDLIEGPESMRFTVFASENLPVTICSTKDAENLYEDLIGSELFKVPVGDKKRMAEWPNLVSSNEINLTGIDWETSCADIVLSSAGWISVTLGHQLNCVLKAWTPEGRGIYTRNSILSKAVCLRGQKVRHSPAYKKSSFFIN